MILATCANIAALLMSAHGGEEIKIKGVCPSITVTKRYATPVTVDASQAIINGLRVLGGGNLIWRGGVLKASGGSHARGIEGYGVLLRDASTVTIEKATLTGAKKAIVLDGAHHITIADNIFDRVSEDGVIATASSDVQITGNRFQNSQPIPTVCTIASGKVLSLSERDCASSGGAWQDGYHADAVQLRNGMSSVLISHNTVTGPTQGLTQMDAPGDAPLHNIVIENNVVSVQMGHAITLKPTCMNCVIRWNTVTRGTMSPFKAAIRPGAALACGNTVQDVQDGTKPCRK